MNNVRKNAKKIILTLICFTTLAFTACGKETAENIGTSTVTPTVTEKPTAEAVTDAPTATTEPEEQLSPGELLAQQYNGWVETPMDLGGRTIKIVSTSTRFIAAEDITTESNQKLEVLEAIANIEKEYNCTIEIERLKAKNLTEALVTAKASGDAYCDILDIDVSSAYLEQIYANNIAMDLNDPLIADIIKVKDNPWREVSSMGYMFNKQLGVSFVANNSTDVLRACILFNKDLAEKYGYSNIYEMVQNKTWTFESFKDICADIASQSDGSVAPILIGSKESLFLPPLIFANGGSTAEIVDGRYVFNGLNDNTMEALNFAVDLVTSGYVTTTDENITFENGNGVFYFTIYNDLCKYTQGVVEVEHSVGLLPAPLGPNGDGNYNSTTYTEPLWSVTNGCENPQEAAAILVALANRTSRHDVIDYELMYNLQDEESAEIFEMMYENMVPDYSRVISGARSAFVNANTAILKLEKTPKQAYEEMSTEVQAIYDSIILTD